MFVDGQRWDEWRGRLSCTRSIVQFARAHTRYKNLSSPVRTKQNFFFLANCDINQYFKETYVLFIALKIGDFRIYKWTLGSEKCHLFCHSISIDL